MTITKRVQKELVQAVAPADSQLLQTLRKAPRTRGSQRRTAKARSAAERNKGKAWTREEHERFLVALNTFPTGPWKAIADFVGTKDSRQTMTHAQKYRQKHERQQRIRGETKKVKHITAQPAGTEDAANPQPAADVIMAEVTGLSVLELPPKQEPTLAKQLSDSPRSADVVAHTASNDPFAPVVADDSLFSLALDAGAAWLGGKSDSDLMQLFAECDEPATDAMWPQIWSTNSLEEIVASCSQLDFLGEGRTN